ncbi:hypothetical protein AHF37_06952 [Paragonimus kellicotti]|nr:hypothetical protein AHF37_06952 [Paragonimus kellicotti]
MFPQLPIDDTNRPFLTEQIRQKEMKQLIRRDYLLLNCAEYTLSGRAATTGQSWRYGGCHTLVKALDCQMDFTLIPRQVRVDGSPVNVQRSSRLPKAPSIIVVDQNRIKLLVPSFRPI